MDADMEHWLWIERRVIKSSKKLNTFPPAEKKFAKLLLSKKRKWQRIQMTDQD
jgi:hypothetical protein